MNKSLVLTMALTLGVTASAYAANPFSDVPAGHWAYASINQLSAAGIIDGYGDNTFGGERLMTRYEMAQIVAKAMANGANVDRLAAEFADELDTLGVRVAALEKKSDSVRITGQARFSYRDISGDTKGTQSRLRTRLTLNGMVNEDWNYIARLENNQYFHDSFTPDRSNTGEEDVSLNWAYVSGKLGGAKVEAGRQDFVYTDTLDTRGDGVKLSYGDTVKLTGWAFKAASSNGVNYDAAMDSGDRAYVADLGTKLGVVDANVRYFKADVSGNGAYAYGDKDIYEAAAGLDIAPNLKLNASYFHGDADSANGDSSGYLAGLAWRGAKAADPGSWGVYAKYSDRPMSTYIDPTVFAATYSAYPGGSFAIAGDGYKGYEAGANYTVAKNMVAGLKYTDFKQREGNQDTQTLWSELIVTF